MLDRSQLLSLALLIAVVSIGARIHDVWTDAPSDLPKIIESKSASPAHIEENNNKPFQAVDTKSIVERKLFDPERGMGKSRADREAEAVALATQKIRALILVGTAVLGESRYAIVEDPGDPRLRSPRPELQAGQRGEMRRLKLGDVVEGFKLSQIDDRTILFENGVAKVQIAVDYFRKFETGVSRAPGSAPSGSSPTQQTPPSSLTPRFPRRDARQGSTKSAFGMSLTAPE